MRGIERNPCNDCQKNNSKVHEWLEDSGCIYNHFFKFYFDPCENLAQISMYEIHASLVSGTQTLKCNLYEKSCNCDNPVLAENVIYY